MLVAGCLATSPPLVHAQSTPASPAPAADEPRIRYRAGAEWISAVRWLEPADTPLNPDNSVLGVPQLWGQTELRADIRVEAGSRVTFVVRPRLRATTESTWAGDSPGRHAADWSANWTELYVNWRAGDVVQVTYGLQNFQWGPAELISPSNRLFHEVGLFRDPLYYVRGRHLARVNLSAGKSWSLVALGELGDNGEADFNAGEPFRRQGQAKLEYAAPSGAGYVGVTAGARQHARPWVGEYGSWSLTEGLSAYVDAVHTRGSTAWYPVDGPEGEPGFGRRDESSATWRTLALAGLRYTFANGMDARAEFVHQEAGYSNPDMTAAARAAAAATTRDQFAPYLSPGLELVGRRLALASVRVPDLPPTSRLDIQARYLRSLTDRSGVAFLNLTLDTTDALVLFTSLSATHGRTDAEFSRLARWTVVGGGVWSF